MVSFWAIGAFSFPPPQLMKERVLKKSNARSLGVLHSALMDGYPQNRFLVQLAEHRIPNPPIWVRVLEDLPRGVASAPWEPSAVLLHLLGVLKVQRWDLPWVPVSPNEAALEGALVPHWPPCTAWLGHTSTLFWGGSSTVELLALNQVTLVRLLASLPLETTWNLHLFSGCLASFATSRLLMRLALMA